MALFYDYNVQLPSNQRQVCCSWVENDPLLAVALESRELHFFTDEGEKNPLSSAYSRNADIVTLAAQPRGGALAVGWSDGMVSIWVYKDNVSREVNSPHLGRVGLLKWAPSGNRLMSADDNGLFAVWKVDHRAQLSLGTQYTRQGSITHCVFATNPLQREKEMKSEAFSQHVCPSFFFGGEIGSIHYADDLGHISDIQVLNHAIDSMMFFEERNRLIVITRALQIVVFQVTQEGTVKVTTKFKLSIAGDGTLRETKWASPGLLAMASGEPLIRFWDLQAEENSVLTLPKPSSATSFHVVTIDFSPRRRILVAGTSEGVVLFWRCTLLLGSKDAAANNTPGGRSAAANGAGELGSENLSDASPAGGSLSHRWDLIFSTELGQSVTKVAWNTAFSTLYAVTTEKVVVFHEGSMQLSLCGDVAVIQSRPMLLSVERFREGTITQSSVETNTRVKGLAHDGQVLVVWNGSKAETFEINSENESKKLSQFKFASTAMAVRNETIYRTNGNHVEVCNVQGVVKNTISFTEAEGKPILLSSNGKFIAVGTDNGFVRVFDLSRRDPKATGSMGNFQLAFGEKTKDCLLRMLSINCDGTRVCALLDRMEGALKMRVPLNELIVFNSDLNIFQQYDFGANRLPVSVFFDPLEPRLFACETQKNRMELSVEARANMTADDKNETGGVATGGAAGGGGAGGAAAASASAGASGSGSTGGAVAEKEINILFVSNERGILLQDSFDLDVRYSALLGIQVPRIFLIAQLDKQQFATSASDDRRSAKDTANSLSSHLRTKIMRDFVGLDKVDDAARQALIDFCYHMTIGNMDEAYRSVKLIESASVWENMATMCVKTKRVDVAEVCLGNMGHARGVAALQEAKQEPQIEVPTAMVAIQLGLRDDAARLYRECGRYDLLNTLYQASGYWQKAIEVATKRDRIHLKSAYYAMGRHMEEIGEIQVAMECFEKAGTAEKDIPRMLLKSGKLETLQRFVAQSKDRNLMIWWGQYQESMERFDEAMEYYDRAGDFLSMVRVLCFKKQLEQAAKLVQQSGNKAAAFHLARQFEACNEIQEAIHFYARGGCYNHAMRLAKENHLDSELMTFALMAKPGDMLECAMYFEQRLDMEKAVQLYHKGGDTSKALDLCFRANLFEELHHLTDELGSSTSPVILKKCAEFFVANGHFAKAVHLFLMSNRVTDALEVCIHHNVKITEEMAEQMTPPKQDETSPGDTKTRNDLLMKLAKCLKQQGAYHLATKKYTQAGAKIKAMKCLLKSGDTEKIVFFANVSRNNDIFVLAANYLQTLHWRSDNEILKNIVGFYSKARAFEQLTTFYDACAQGEIEEFRDYEKAIHALHEAVKCASKSTKADAKERLLKTLDRKILLMEQFVAARKNMKQHPGEMLQAVQKLLEEPDIDTAVRIGDALALIAEAYATERDFARAVAVLESMKKRSLVLKNYMDPALINEIISKAGGSAASMNLGSEDKPSSERPSSKESSGRPQAPPDAKRSTAGAGADPRIGSRGRSEAKGATRGDVGSKHGQQQDAEEDEEVAMEEEIADDEK